MFIKAPLGAVATSSSPVFDEKHLEESSPSSPVHIANPVVCSAEFVFDVSFFLFPL